MSGSICERWHRGRGIFREENLRFLIPLEYSYSFDLQTVLKGNLIQPCKEKWLVLMQRYAAWIQKRLKICSAYGLPTNNEALPIGTPGGDKWMLSVRMSTTPILHTHSLSIFLLPLFLLLLSLPLHLYLSSSVSHSLSSIFCCLLLHYHTNTLAHTLGKKNMMWGGVRGVKCMS